MLIKHALKADTQTLFLLYVTSLPPFLICFVCLHCELHRTEMQKRSHIYV